MELLLTIFLSILAYFLGSVSFSYIFTKKETGKDIRDIDVKNAGAYNVYKNISKKFGTLVGFLDGLKAFVIIIIGELILGLNSINTIIAAYFSVIGHCFPIFYKFYGGKGAATVIAIMVYYVPLDVLVCVIPIVILCYFLNIKGLSPLFLILFSLIISHIFNFSHASSPIILAMTCVSLLTGLVNLIIIVSKRDKKKVAVSQ